MIDPAATSSKNNPDPGLPSPLRILALLPEVETVAACLRCAAAAGGLHAALSAVHLGFDSGRTFVSAEEQDIQQLRDIYEGTPKVRRDLIKAAYDAFVAASPDASAQWKDDDGEIDANVLVEAHGADLVVIGRPRHLDASDALHSALFGAHRLVLVAPPKFGQEGAKDGASVGRRMIVGWKPGDAVKRAVEAAQPWLRRADKITVLWVAKQGAQPYDLSARDFFAKLGLNAEIIGLQRDRQSVGRQLLSEASRLGGDCLLIGAYRHGALWDAILGGVTRDALAHAEIPVFLMR
jgi:nucleotide-binding universal stress UspA family protein